MSRYVPNIIKTYDNDVSKFKIKYLISAVQNRNRIGLKMLTLLENIKKWFQKLTFKLN